MYYYPRAVFPLVFDRPKMPIILVGMDQMDFDLEIALALDSGCGMYMAGFACDVTCSLLSAGRGRSLLAVACILLVLLVILHFTL